ncbi:MAG: radical SAM protein [Candidatus Omnitrophica bacterium]|nr:radical SAM protein [Candidatus Omnitrophota bacterium]
MAEEYRYIYGPVFSWRLGRSLGIDLLSQQEKVCNFDCLYCQLGATKGRVTERKVYVPEKEVIGELERMPSSGIDHITFSGRGEPALAQNLGRAIKAVKSLIKIPVAVITNSSLINKEEVRSELFLADLVIAKLDAYSQGSLKIMNNPDWAIKFPDILEGIKKFRKEYNGKLALQMMFIDSNKSAMEEYARLADHIKADEIQLNTPLRPCGVKPLSRKEVFMIKDHFTLQCKGASVVSVYDQRPHPQVVSISAGDTLRRRGKPYS